MQPAEEKARANYRKIIKDHVEVPLANQASLELAELLTEREQWDDALQILTDAIDNEPPPELTDRIRLQLGLCRLRKGDAKAGLVQFELVANNPESPMHAQGTYYMGEGLLHLKEWKEAIKHLSKFRDHGPFQNVPGVTDRALLRLGHALAQVEDWPASRGAFEQVMSRFPNGSWLNEARYGAAWAWQNQKQYDQAVNLYSQIAAATVAEIAAKAQLQIGLCRRDQKRLPEAATALLVVPFTYDYPEWSGAALYEAHRVFLDMKQPEQARRLLERLVRDYPDSRWGQLAAEELKKGEEQ